MSNQRIAGAHDSSGPVNRLVDLIRRLTLHDLFKKIDGRSRAANCQRPARSSMPIVVHQFQPEARVGSHLYVFDGERSKALRQRVFWYGLGVIERWEEGPCSLLHDLDVRGIDR